MQHPCKISIRRTGENADMRKPKTKSVTETRNQLRRKQELPLHFMLLAGLVIVLIYNYGPMVGLLMAFENYKPTKGLFGSEWVGLGNFRRLFSYPNIESIIFNTVYISVFKLILGIIVPVLFALLLNEIKNRFFSGYVQVVTCLPYFLSWVILGGVFTNILSPSNGIVNEIIKFFGGTPIYFLGDNQTFPWTLIITDTWKNFGYSSIVYLAAMSSIDPALYEAAEMDGAGRFKKILHVTLPGIVPMIFVMTVLSLGNVLNAGFDQIFNLYSPQVYQSGDILDTFIYRLGIEDAQYSMSTAVGLLKSVISLVLISIGYKLAEKYGDYRVF